MTVLTHPPLVVGAIRPERLAALAAGPPGDRIADLAEARLDLAVAKGETAGPLPDLHRFFADCARLEQTGMPVLATIRLVADGGRWTVDAERLPWFQKALEVVSWVDVEVESEIASEVIARAHAARRRVIVSHHDFAGTPETDALEAIAARAAALGADIVKVATLVRSLEDHDHLLDLLRRRRPQADGTLAVVGMGSFGTALRTYLPSIGSRLTYGYLDEVAAPGQISARELVQRLIADCPAYAAFRNTRDKP